MKQQNGLVFLQHLGADLMEALCQDFGENAELKQSEDSTYLVLDFGDGVTVKFMAWGGKPTYIMLFKGSKYLFEFDLSRIVCIEGHYSWYLAKPSNKENLRFLEEKLSFIDDLANDDPDYFHAVVKQKQGINGYENTPRVGYVFIVGANREEFKALFVDFMKDVIDLKISDSARIVKNEFGLDDPEALEGYGLDSKILKRGRNQALAVERKTRDNYTCQTCDRRIEIKGKFIAECHHLHPIHHGVRSTTLSDLITLCPTCHRISHTKRPPHTPDQIKEFLKKQA